jgi:hypothetical protein
MNHRIAAALIAVGAGILATALPNTAAAQQVVVVNCESISGRQQYCEVETRWGVRLVEEFSRGRCREGDTWGYDAGRIWVRNGCRGAFELGTGDDIIVCESRDHRRSHCRADLRGAHVVLVRPISRTRCDEGLNWGYDERGIWVDQGCAAEFAIEPGNRYGRRGANPGAYGGRRDVIACDSEDYRRQFCSVGRAQTAVLVRQRSRAACIEDETWGYDGRSVWVDQGCAGDFEVVR